jgi:hypothetical protein
VQTTLSPNVVGEKKKFAEVILINESTTSVPMADYIRGVVDKTINKRGKVNFVQN